MLGVKLLVRGYRSIAFTPEGERLFRSADSAVQQLQDAIGALREFGPGPPVTISSSIGLVGLWLLPRLGSFLRQHPGIDLRVSANNRVGDLRDDGLDLTIRYCAPEAAPKGAMRLFGETVAPVAHPSLTLSAIDGPRTLERQVLLEHDGPYRPWLQWNEWLASQGWNTIETGQVLRFNHYDQIIHAALAGHGIALGRLELIDSMLADGRLLALKTPKRGVETSHAYWLIHADPSPRGGVLEVIRWIQAEAKRTETAILTIRSH
jgi:DNA-binding transcriptional LysR family regulator